MSKAQASHSGFEELDWLAQSCHLNSTRHVWDELESQPTSVLGLTNAPVAQWEQSPAATFTQKSFQEKGKVIIVAKRVQLQVGGIFDCTQFSVRGYTSILPVKHCHF